jgi:hypothetical protein
MPTTSISQKDLDILKAVNEYDFLTIRQMQRILALSSYEKLSARMARLARLERVAEIDEETGEEIVVKTGVLACMDLPHPKHHGVGGTLLYKVGDYGKKLLREEGVEYPRFDVDKNEPIVTPHKWHTVWVNDFFISASLYAKQSVFPAVEIARVWHELEIRRDKKRFLSYAPDGWIDIRIEERFCFVIELETGSQVAADVRKKVRLLLEFIEKGYYEKAFGTDIFKCLFFALGGEKHRKAILQAVATVLRETGYDIGHLFLVTEVHPSEMRIFTDAVWWMPNVYTPVKLF